MVAPGDDIRSRVADVEDDAVAWRRHLHMNPELAFQERETSRFIHERLASFGGLELTPPTETSAPARAIRRRPGKVLAIRADIDALPIVEENTFEFASRRPGTMHACGHDGHAAMLLATAKLLTGLRAELVGEVRFLFQHAEEVFPGGAKEMIAAGA